MQEFQIAGVKHWRNLKLQEAGYMKRTLIDGSLHNTGPKFHDYFFLVLMMRGVRFVVGLPFFSVIDGFLCISCIQKSCKLPLFVQQMSQE